MKTAVNNKYLASVFRESLKHLSAGDDDKHTYICHALGEGVCVPYYVILKARAIVQSRLEGHATLNTWLLEKIGEAYFKATYEQIQAHRIAWVKLIIEELEAK